MNRLIEVPEYEVQADVCVDPARTALVVVDMQNDFVREGGGLLVPDAAATIPTIKALLELARAHGMRVVYSQNTHREGDPEWRIWPEHAREGSWGWEIVDVRGRDPARRDLCAGPVRPGVIAAPDRVRLCRTDNHRRSPDLWAASREFPADRQPRDAAMTEAR
jgi:hypothetical protein